MFPRITVKFKFHWSCFNIGNDLIEVWSEFFKLDWFDIFKMSMSVIHDLSDSSINGRLTDFV